ncbi:acetamidase/formamidase family protein [Tateyamaria omphalii]|uniref:acetamidase/formamidase family protein n=1 Tax=Tateyamaria omphalii TaxID=299262 RepID=UPI00167A780C|nr:acetamidase/formamidase family protein [Tateyamaria omphalii]
MTGPIEIEGVKAGDAIKVEILDMQLPSSDGWLVVTGRGPLQDRVSKFLRQHVKITAGGVNFNDDIILPIKPMISRIGVAPLTGSVQSNHNGTFGGAMGNPMVTKGASIFLPTFHDGALLTLADGHALHGSGEVACSAIECAVNVVLRVTKEEDIKVQQPLVMNDEFVCCMGFGDTMEIAVEMAVKGTSDLLMQTRDVTADETAMLISCMGSVKFGLAGHEPYSAMVEVPRSLLEM